MLIVGAILLLLALVIWAAGAAVRPRQKRYMAWGGAAKPKDVRLVDIEDRHLPALAAITRRRATMKWVGDGRPWSRRKVRRFIDYGKAERKENAADQKHFYWGIELSSANAQDHRLIGVVGIHPVTYDQPTTEGLFFLTQFIEPGETGKGYGKAALRAALDKFWAARDDPVYADVRVDNEASLALMRGQGFEDTGPTKIGRKEFRRFRLERAGQE